MGKGSHDLERPGLLLAGALVLLLCVLATASGQGVAWPVFEPDPPAVAEDERPTDESAGEEGGEREDAEQDGDRAEDGAGLLLPGRSAAVALVVALGLLVAAVLLRLRISLRGRRPREGRRAVGALLDPVEPELLDDADALADALAEGIADLDAGTARNGIVAAWLRLESATESERFHRDPADTPAEFVARVLASYDLDGAAIDRLAALYREARFSEHSLGEVHRSEAATCLATLLRGLPADRRRNAR
ncbi:MAG TPA: DUF4129 domain-containing protein [Nocardioides sp.]|nr:DUF4129 domain-containing protein [Nocardioides sp.]